MAQRRRSVEDRRRKLRERVIWHKKRSHCVDCGTRDWRVLQFHHLDKSTKRFNIAHAAKLQVTIEALDREVAKCICLCANDHQLRHWNERNEEVDNSGDVDVG